MLVSLRCVVIRRRRRDDACRRSAGPAVPPSLAPVLPEPSLLFAAGSTGRFRAVLPAPQGGWSPPARPRACTVPGSLLAACAATRPVVTCSRLQVIAGGESFS